MMAERPFTILVGVDGSEPSMNAVRMAMRVAAEARPSRLHLCAVLMPVQEMAMHDTSARPARTFDDNFLERAREEARRGGVETATRLLHGDPADVLAHEADALGADLLVLGTRDEGPLHEHKPGSLVLRVLDQAACPVVLCR